MIFLYLLIGMVIIQIIYILIYSDESWRFCFYVNSLILTCLLILCFTFNSRAETIDYSSITISDSEYHDVVRVVAGESQSDTYESQLAVVEVIFNRCLDSRFNNTPYSVVSEKGQFSVWKMRYDSWIEPEYGEKPLNELLSSKESKILNNKEYVLFSTKKMKYGYDYIKIGKTYFGKLK